MLADNLINTDITCMHRTSNPALPIPSSTWRTWLLLGLGMASLGVYASILSLGNLRGATTPAYLVRYAVVFVLYLLALLTASDRRQHLLILWSCALLFRLVLLFNPPTLSDDVFRYMWDGRLQNMGLNPYAQVVNSPALDAYSTPNRSLVNHPQMASPYQPAAQIYFALAYRMIPENVTIFQAGASLLDLAAGLFLTLILRRMRLPLINALVFLWNPLVVVESAHGAHVDALMTALILASLWAFSRQRHSVSALLLGLATLVKPLPVLLLPVLGWRWGWKRLLGYGGVVLFGIALYANAGLVGREGTGVFGAMLIYLGGWAFNAGLFYALRGALSSLVGSGTLLVEVVSRLLLGGMMLLSLGLFGYRAHRLDHQPGWRRALLRLSILPLAAYLLFTTTFHPWYLVPLLAMLPLWLDSPLNLAALRIPASRPAAHILLFTTAWLYLSAAVSLSYLAYLEPASFNEVGWVLWVEFLPFYVLLLMAFWAWIARRRRIA